MTDPFETQGRYFHSECRGCVSYGTECEEECEYDDYPDPCPYFKSAQEDIDPLEGE